LTPKHTSRKGAFLSEMAVSLVVIAIVATIVVSFSVAVGDQVKLSKAKLNASEEISLVEDLTDTWIRLMTAQNAHFTFAPNAISADTPTGVFALSFENNTFTASLPDDQQMKVETEHIRSLSFDAMQRNPDPTADGYNDALFFCTVTYTVSQKQGSDTLLTQVFTVNPRIGETIGGGENG